MERVHLLIKTVLKTKTEIKHNKPVNIPNHYENVSQRVNTVFNFNAGCLDFI